MKADRATTIKRIQEIYQMMCQGANSMDIVQYGADNWKIKQRGMYKLIKYAMGYISKRVEKNINEMRFEANIRFDKLFTKLYKDGKYRDAGYIQSQKNKINGLETVNQNVKITSYNEDVEKIIKGIIKSE